MTDLRMAVARAIGATMRLPNHMDRADEVLKAIEAAGYAVVPRNKLKITQDPDVLYGDKNSYAVEWRDDNLEEPAR